MTVQLVDTVKSQGSGGGPNATSGAGWTPSGTTLLAAYIGSYNGSPGMSDSLGNTWTSLIMQSNVIDGQMWYVNSATPSIADGQTFTSTNNAYQGLCVMAFSGTDTSPLDQQSGGTATSTTVQPNAITSTSGYLNLTGLAYGTTNTNSISGGGFSAIELDAAYILANSIGNGFTWDLSDGSASNPTWTHGDSTIMCTTIASFKAAGGGGGAVTKARGFIF